MFRILSMEHSAFVSVIIPQLPHKNEHMRKPTLQILANQNMLLARASYHSVGVEGHDHPRHTEVCHGQGDDEVVGDVLEGSLLGHGEDDQHIAEHHDDAEN